MKLQRLMQLTCVASLAITICACNGSKATNDEKSCSKDSLTATDMSAQYVIERVSAADSADIAGGYAKASCSLSYLKNAGSDSKLVDNVNSWIRDMLGVKDTAVAMGTQLADRVVSDRMSESRSDLTEFAKDAAREGYEFAMQYEFDYDVKPIATTQKYITFLFTSYVYTGGAHGGAAAIGQTFNSSNGYRLDRDMFRPSTEEAVLQLVKEAIAQQYFDVPVSQLSDQLLLNDSTFPMPVNPPYFTEKGVNFQYQQYEIAPYAAGMPECVIPFDKLKPYFTDSVAKLLGLGKD